MLCILLCPRTAPLPPIIFVSKVEKMDKVDATDVEKDELNNLEFLPDPENPALDSK
jgi:hypothetical protein